MEGELSNGAYLVRGKKRELEHSKRSEDFGKGDGKC